MSAALLEVDIIWRQQGLKNRATFQLHAGVTALIGPSGAGKTSLARMIVGLDSPESGAIRFGEYILYNSGKKRNIPAAERNIGLVMQQSALFPHLSVEQNIRFSGVATEKLVTKAVKILSLSTLLGRRTDTLSGGETKRVAIARAIAAAPSLLILDEPMNGLDPRARGAILPMIKALGRASNVPILMITHHIEDMLRVADHAVLMQPRKVIKSGSLEDVLAAPECAELMGLADASQLLSTTITNRQNDLLTADLGGDTLYLPDLGEEMGSKATLRVFASDISIAKTRVDDISILNQLEAEIVQIEQSDNQATLTLKLTRSGLALKSRLTVQSVNRLQLTEGQRIYALIKAVSVKDIEL